MTTLHETSCCPSYPASQNQAQSQSLVGSAPGRSLQSTDMINRPSLTPQSTFINTSQNQPLLQPFAISSSSESTHFPEVDSMPTQGLQSPIAVPPVEVRQPQKRQLLKRRVSWLAILGCLLGFVVMGASVWLVFSQGFTPISRPSPTA